MAAVTMTGSALAALAQDDIKRVLAYSTIGQLGYMTGALAVGDRGAAVFHLLSHGAFKALLFLGAGVVIHAAGTNSLAAMSRMKGLRDRVPDAYWTMTVALLALAAIPPFSGFFSKEAVLGSAEHVATGHAEAIPSSAGWIVLVSGLLTALLTAAYATRLWLLAFRGHGAEAPDHGKQPFVMNAVLWVLAIPSLAFGLTVGVVPDWFDGRSLTPTLTTSVLGTGVALVGGLVTYAAWRHTTALAAGAPLGAVAAHPDADGGVVEAEAIATHAAAYGDIAYAPIRRTRAVSCSARCTATRPPASTWTPSTRPCSSGRSWPRPHWSASSTARSSRPMCAAPAAVPNWLGRAVRRAQTGNVQTYLSALLAGTVVLAIAVVLVATAGA